MGCGRGWDVAGSAQGSCEHPKTPHPLAPWVCALAPARCGGRAQRELAETGVADARAASVFQERKLCAHPRLEIYKEDRIYFVCPLARQGDFYVPEMKELERKSRAVAAEAEDAQTDITGTVARVLLWPAAAHLRQGANTPMLLWSRRKLHCVLPVPAQGLATLFPSPGLPWQSLTHPGGTRRALGGTRSHPWQGSELLSVQPWGRHQSAVVKAELGAEAFGCSWACFSPCHIHLS